VDEFSWLWIELGNWSWIMDEVDESYEHDNVRGPLVVTN
jgi:hypothetical protein